MRHLLFFIFDATKFNLTRLYSKVEFMNMKHILLFVAIQIVLTPSGIFAQTEKFSYQATRVEIPPVIDGRLTDDCWENYGEWAGTFTQQSPNEGQPETEATYVKILYDNHNIYVAFRALDSEPDKINRWLAPRDQVKGDAVAICFDSYADKRTAFCFGLSAGGTRFDFVLENDKNDDYSWNAVWEGKTSIGDKGWYAEFRIPLSQLRYSNTNGEQEWGFHAIRMVDRKKEMVHLSLIPQQNKGYVYSFGKLTGISDLPKSRRMEFTPYSSLRYKVPEKNSDIPSHFEKDWDFGAGLDGKIGLSSDFTLDFTINPDFGQVEADPSTINLTAFETYYDEKRPFFLEGKNIFSMNGETMFYSRRIGSPPGWRPGDEYGEYSSVPQKTRIISAIKLSGKNKNGLSLGALNSITAKETVKILQDGREYRMTAQPAVSYSVARVQQDINKGNTIIGGMLTSTNRFLKDDHLSFLNRNAYTGGVDFAQYFKNREYYVKGTAQYSYMEGSQDAITALQRSPVHFYQREGAPHISVDSSRTNLQGNAGTITIGRGGENKIVSEQVFVWSSPGFELNDLGYLQAADYKMLRGYVAYIESKPQKDFLRNYHVAPFYRLLWDYSNTTTLALSGLEINTSFTNKWGFYLSGFYESRNVENSMLRGGPPVLLNPRWGTDMMIDTDESKKVSARAYHGTVLSDKRYAHFAWAEVNYRPIPNLGLSGRLNYTYWKKGLEYAGQLTVGAGERIYLMSALRQDVAGFTFRADYSIIPDLSVQFYGNPFISFGKYTQFKRATHTMDKKYENRFVLLDNDVLTYDPANNEYSVTETNGHSYSFGNPDFSFREFRFNLVIRWEYRPNSTIYLVWSQDRSGSYPGYNSSYNQNMKELFQYYPDNVFMIKLNYWFSL